MSTDDASTLNRLEQVRGQVHDQAKALLGVGPGTVSSGLRHDLRAAGARWYPLLALGGLVVVDRAQSFAVYVLGPGGPARRRPSSPPSSR